MPTSIISQLILIWGTLCLVLSIYSFYKVKANKNNVDFIFYWAFLTGSFVWEDLLVFGFLHFIGVAISFIFQDVRLWYLFFLVFWIVRSAGETLYFFLQQFIQPSHHPHKIDHHFELLRKIFGNISNQKCFILFQIVFQAIMVISTFALINLLKGW